MMFASAYLALAMLAQSQKVHAKSEPPRIITSDNCNRPQGEDCVTFIVSHSSALAPDTYGSSKDPQDAKVLEIRCYLS